MLLPLARGAVISEADAVCEPDVGLRAGLITGRLYTVFVLMALVTTAATGPLLTLVSRRTAKVPAEPPGLDVGTAGLLETL